MTEMRHPSAVEKPVVVTIGGSDSGGGAGIQADLKTIEATDGFGVSAITAITAQNTQGVESSHVLPTESIEAQIDAIRTDFDVRAIKTGMLATADIVEMVAEYAAAFDCPIVVDPVMVATTGDRLLTEDGESTYTDLIAESTLVTPNADEAAVLTGVEPTDTASAREAGRELLSNGADAVLIKGGHIPGDDVVDALITRESVESFRHRRIETDATHGSGCTLSAAIATRLAHGERLVDAVEDSVEFLQRAVRYHHAAGSGPGAVHHLVGLRDRAARAGTIEMGHEIAGRLADLGDSASAHDTVVSTPYAETVADVAAVDSVRERTEDEGTGGGAVRFGASNRLARRLLEAREADPTLRIGVECRLRPATEGVRETSETPVVIETRDGEPGAFVFARAVGEAVSALERGIAGERS